MKNGIIFSALAIAIGAGGYYAYTQQNGGSNAVSASYVPADTLFFMGDLEPVSFKEAFTPFQARFSQLFNSPGVSVNDELKKLKEEMNQNPQEWNDGMRFLVGLYAEYVNSITKNNFSPDVFGLSDKTDMALYSVGALPVLRIKLSNEVNFDKFITQAEANTNAKSETATFKNISYKRYIFDKNEKKPAALALIKKDGFAVITLDLGKMIPENDFAVAIGAVAPAQSLIQSKTLETLAQQYGFQKHSLGFINNEGLIKTLTRKDSPLAMLLNQMSDGESDTSMAQFRSPECQKDIEGMAALWPREIFGYTKSDVKSNPMVFASQFRFESKDAATLASLQKLRGFVPDFGKDKQPLFSFGLGLNIDQLSPVVNDLWTRATNATFTCPALQQAQNELRTANPAMLAMGTAMVHGLQGASINVTDLKLNANAQSAEQPFEKLSFLATISAQDPKQLWGVLGMVNPEMAAAIQLPENGKSIDLPIPPVVTLPAPVKLGVYGNHIAIFSGETAEKLTADLGKMPLAANGFYKLGLDYGLVADLAAFAGKHYSESLDALETEATAMEEGVEGAEPQAADPQATAAAAETKTHHEKEKAEMQQVLKMMESMRGIKLQTGFDFDKDGIAIQGDMQVPAK